MGCDYKLGLCNENEYMHFSGVAVQSEYKILHFSISTVCRFVKICEHDFMGTDNCANLVNEYSTSVACTHS